MKTNFTKYFKVLLSITLLTCLVHFSASAQNTGKSRVAVVANDTKTNIWVSDFPKKTTVVILDTDNNLLSVISTNDFGAAFLTLPTGLKTGVVAKTMNGEIIVSNKAVIKNKQEEQNVVAKEQEDSNKA